MAESKDDIGGQGRARQKLPIPRGSFILPPASPHEDGTPQAARAHPQVSHYQHGT